MSGQQPVTPGRLFTWVDIDEYFARLAAAGQWAPWLQEVDAYWDGVEISVAEEIAPEVVWDWLGEKLGENYIDAGRQVLFLEALDNDENTLDVRVVAGPMPPASRDLRWNERRVVRELGDAFQPPAPEEFPDGVQVCAFHSFKGGVGRTLHCVALALELTRRQPGESGPRSRVLLVDADMEAPGISWMVSGDGNRADIAFDDLLALLHGSAPEDLDRVIALARKFLVNQEQDGVLVLPATRNTARIGPPQIQPVDLLTPERSPHFVTETLARLTHAVGADTCLIDLRAGTSELSAPVLLDPRVHRVFVSTISDQSVQGTANLINHLALRAPSQKATDPACAVLITQFQEDDHGPELADASEALADSLSRTFHVASAEEGDDTAAVDQQVISEPLASPFTPQLLALPRRWGDVRRKIEQTSLGSVVSPLGASLVPAASTSLDAVQDKQPRDARVRLAELARSLTYAETAEAVDDFLPTAALQNLAQHHRTSAPVVVAVGAKGAGKTFTYLQICRHQTWGEFGQATGVDGVELAAPLVPVLDSVNLSVALRGVAEKVRRESARQLTGDSPASFLSIRDFIKEALGQELSDLEWRKVWLTCLARAAGIDTAPENAESRLGLLARDHQAIFVFDGLEDLFQDFSKDERQQRALRVLLTDCGEWLRSLRGQPLGMVVFVRRDLVMSAIRQNVRQFLARHKPYELRWDRTEALRLVAWVCAEAGALSPNLSSPEIRRFPQPQLSQILLQVWGQKLGSENSREARSEDWFLAALSDYNEQIQARDIVSFLAEASEKSSVGDSSARWQDRLLTPRAMRSALPACSGEKIAAISQENPPVGNLFGRLRTLPYEDKRIPFTLAAAGLDSGEADILEENGALFQENGQCWMPEIFRHGLGFRISRAGRPRVTSISKLIRARGTR